MLCPPIMRIVMEALIIRSATLNDIPLLASLWYEKTVLQQQADSRLTLAPDGLVRWSEAACAWLEQPSSAIFVAGDVPAGYVVTAIEQGAPGLLPERIGSILDLTIDAHGYHAGAGRALVNAARDWLRGQGVEQMRIPVLRRHAVEQAFWRALGAKEWFDCLWMNS
jgi:GNAT superfamily N-acetyltransferase